MAEPDVILTPDQRVRVFISSTRGELAAERAAARRAIARLHLVPVWYESGARPHPPRSMYRAYLEQSQVFVGIYWQRYGWVAPGMEISGLEDEFRKARRRVAAELISDLERLYQRKKAADKELRDLLRATGTTLTSLNGIGPSAAARLLVEAGDLTRFPSKAHFASWNGTAPIDASSGDQIRHRLSRGGNRQVNRALHIMAVVQLRHRGSEGRAYYDRKVAAGKTPMEAMRCLKRRLSDIVYHQMILDHRAAQAGPGGHVGASLISSAAGSYPGAGSSDKSLPGPATSNATPSHRAPETVSLT